jgi:hypothetical protein
MNIYQNDILVNRTEGRNLDNCRNSWSRWWPCTVTLSLEEEPTPQPPPTTWGIFIYKWTAKWTHFSHYKTWWRYRITVSPGDWWHYKQKRSPWKVKNASQLLL